VESHCLHFQGPKLRRPFGSWKWRQKSQHKYYYLSVETSWTQEELNLDWPLQCDTQISSIFTIFKYFFQRQIISWVRLSVYWFLSLKHLNVFWTLFVGKLWNCLRRTACMFLTVHCYISMLTYACQQTNNNVSLISSFLEKLLSSKFRILKAGGTSWICPFAVTQIIQLDLKVTALGLGKYLST